MAYLYRHIRLDRNEPFYIGISETDDRYKRSKDKSTRNSIWKAITRKTKYKIEIIFENDDIEFIKEKEIEFIKLYGRINKKTGTLANMTDGGDLINNSGLEIECPSLGLVFDSMVDCAKYFKTPAHNIKYILNGTKINTLGIKKLNSDYPNYEKKLTHGLPKCISKVKNGFKVIVKHNRKAYTLGIFDSVNTAENELTLFRQDPDSYILKINDKLGNTRNTSGFRGVTKVHDNKFTVHFYNKKTAYRYSHYGSAQEAAEIYDRLVYTLTKDLTRKLNFEYTIPPKAVNIFKNNYNENIVIVDENYRKRIETIEIGDIFSNLKVINKVQIHSKSVYCLKFNYTLECTCGKIIQRDDPSVLLNGKLKTCGCRKNIKK